jgi:hypothetical protein
MLKSVSFGKHKIIGEYMITIQQIEDKIHFVQNKKVIIDKDVAGLYGLETKRINEAVANNPEKFPAGYIVDLNKEEWEAIRSKVSTLKSPGRGKHTKYIPKAFTEKGLYMLATILKSTQATQATIAIIETFTKIRELNRTMNELSGITDQSAQKKLMQKSGEMITELFEDGLTTNETETTIELNFALLKFKHKVKRK